MKLDKKEQLQVMSTLLPEYTKHWRDQPGPPYSFKQKIEAVDLSGNFGFRITCAALGISSRTLSKWLKEYRF